MPRKKIDRSMPSEGNVIDIKTGKLIEKEPIPAICERIRYYRTLMGIEQKQLAKLIGISSNAVSNWEQGRSRPDINLLPDICDALNITFYELFNVPDPSIKYTAGQQLMMDSYIQLSRGHQLAVNRLVESLTTVELAEKCPQLEKLTYFEKRLAAGLGDASEFEDEGVPVYVYSSTPYVEKADCIFTVNGDSMEPDFHNGDTVLVQRVPSGPDMKYGEIGAFIVGNETYIKVFEEDGLHSLNPDYKPMYYNEESAPVYLIGRVLGIIEKRQFASPAEVSMYESVHGE